MLVLFHGSRPIFLAIRRVSKVTGQLLRRAILFQSRFKPVGRLRVFLLLVLFIAFAHVLPYFFLRHKRHRKRGSHHQHKYIFYRESVHLFTFYFVISFRCPTLYPVRLILPFEQPHVTEQRVLLIVDQYLDQQDRQKYPRHDGKFLVVLRVREARGGSGFQLIQLRLQCPHRRVRIIGTHVQPLSALRDLHAHLFVQPRDHHVSFVVGHEVAPVLQCRDRRPIRGSNSHHVDGHSRLGSLCRDIHRVPLVILPVGDNNHCLADILVAREGAHSQPYRLRDGRSLDGHEARVNSIEENFGRLCIGGERHLHVRLSREHDQCHFIVSTHVDQPREDLLRAC